MSIWSGSAALLAGAALGFTASRATASPARQRPQEAGALAPGGLRPRTGSAQLEPARQAAARALAFAASVRQGMTEKEAELRRQYASGPAPQYPGGSTTAGGIATAGGTAPVSPESPRPVLPPGPAAGPRHARHPDLPPEFFTGEPS